MKFLTIALFLLCIHVSASIINAIQATSGWQMPHSETWFKEIEQESIKNEQYFQNQAIQDTSVSFGFGDFVKGFFNFLGVASYSVAVVPYTINQFLPPGLSDSDQAKISTPISILIYFIYGLAIAQFISNRAAKGMQ